MHILFLLVCMSSINCAEFPLKTAKLDLLSSEDLPCLEKEAQLSSYELTAQSRRRALFQELHHIPLPTVLLQLICQYIPDSDPQQKPMCIAYKNDHDGSLQIRSSFHSFRIFTIKENAPMCVAIDFHGKCYEWLLPMRWGNSPLVQVITEKLAVPPLTQQHLTVDKSSFILSPIPIDVLLRKVGIDRDALFWLWRLLKIPFKVVAKNTEKYQEGERRSAILLDAGYTMADWGNSVARMYEKTLFLQQLPDYASLQGKFSSLQEYSEGFVQAYKAHGAQFVTACKQVSEREDVGLLFDAHAHDEPSRWCSIS